MEGLEPGPGRVGDAGNVRQGKDLSILLCGLRGIALELPIASEFVAFAGLSFEDSGEGFGAEQAVEIRAACDMGAVQARIYPQRGCQARSARRWPMSSNHGDSCQVRSAVWRKSFMAVLGVSSVVCSKRATRLQPGARTAQRPKRLRVATISASCWGCDHWRASGLMYWRSVACWYVDGGEPVSVTKP